MNLKKNKLRDDYIDISKIIISVWEKKFLIFIVTLIFMVAGYSFAKNQTKKFRYELIIEKLKHEDLVGIFPIMMSKESKLDLISIFNERLATYALSTNDMKEFIKKNQIDSNQANINTVVNINEKIIQLVIVSSVELTTNFLNNYISYIKKNCISLLNRNIKYHVQAEIDLQVYNLQIAKKIELEEPILLKNLSQDSITIFNGSGPLYLQGTKVIAQSINLLEEFKKKIDQQTLDLDLLYYINNESAFTDYSTNLVIFISFTLGLFLSVFFIFFRMINFR